MSNSQANERRGGHGATGDEDPARATLGKFRIIFGAIRQHFRAVEKACGVSGAQVWVLATLAQSPGLRVTELAEALSIHASTASNLLDKIEKAGLLRRERGQTDQRVVRLYLTEAGTAALASAPQPFTGVLPHALGQLHPDTLARLGRDLDELIGHLDLANSRDAQRPLSEL
ncbi:MAG: MarR family transcriptional regulator [Pseudomonadota bacterium]